MTTWSALDQLLPELQRRILLHLESFDTLHAFILASPRIHQVFRLNRKAILSKIARRRFSPAAIRDILATEKLREIEKPPFSRDTVLQFFSKDFHALDDFHGFILPPPLSTRLAKLDRTVRFFINDYAQNTLPIVTQLSLSERPAIATKYEYNCDPPQSPVSRSESDRLRRAFCRFETYRQLFSRCSSDLPYDHRNCDAEPPLTVYEQAERFFQHTPAYQAVEVACVRDYLHRRMRGVFDQVEDELVQRLRADDTDSGDKHRQYGYQYSTHEGCHQQWVTTDHFFGYSGKYDQYNHIEYLCSLGLPYIRTLLESAGDQRHDLLLRESLYCSGQYDRCFITEALGLDHLVCNDQLYGWYDRDIESCLDEASRLDLPAGWLWAHEKPYYSGLVDLHDKAFRDWGYVFWDLKRLQQAGVPDME